MSDRAATDLVFNKLLKDYREKLLKEHGEN